VRGGFTPCALQKSAVLYGHRNIIECYFSLNWDMRMGKKSKWGMVYNLLVSYDLIAMKLLDRIFGSNLLSVSLRIKIMLVFILPMILILSAIFYIHNKRGRSEFETLEETNAIHLADVMLGSLNHAMLMNDSQMIDSVINEAGKDPTIEEIWIVSSNLKVFRSTNSSKIGLKLDLGAAGCIECHQYAPAERPRAMHLWLDKNYLRVSTPIPNAPECQTCHSSSQTHLGVFLIDLSTQEIEEHLKEDLIYNIFLSVISILCLILLAYLLIQWLIVRRVNVIHAALTQLGRRDFSTRITTRWHTRDEITQLADHFNNMAASFEVLQAEHEQKDRVRAQAIIDERERIARELHDGVAQFMGYLSAKIGAIRMALNNEKKDIANRNLEQVEQAIRDQSNEVRSSIIGLNMAGNIDRGFAANVREFVNQCNRLDDLALELEVANDVNNLIMDVEKELQLFRILQEAVSNIRKHSMASEASIRLEKNETKLLMIISDNGVGFDPVQTGLERGGHFGLQIMFERAREIGAHVEIKSNPGLGTTVNVSMDLSESWK
jgi:signal transduction histidine kinase